MNSMSISDNKKIGIALTTFGLIFLFLGVLLFFDSGLLAIGNVLFLIGIVLLIGPHRTVHFFFGRRGKLRGTICFLLGITMVLYGWAVIGMLIEVFGILNLFGNFFPIIIVFIRQTPIIGPLISKPPISTWIDSAFGQCLPM